MKIVHINYNFFDYGRPITNQIRKDGYTVEEFTIKPPNPGYIKRIMYRRKKISYVSEYQKKYIETKIFPYFEREGNNIDCILISLIYMSEDYLNKIKALCPKAKLVLNLMDDVSGWDENEREDFRLYDKIMSYCKADAEEYGYVYNPNFYVDMVPENKKKYKWSFIGTNTELRRKMLDYFISEGFDNNAFISMYRGSGSGIKDILKYDVFNKKLTNNFEKYLRCRSIKQEKACEIFSQSKCIVEINAPKQRGLSFRTFHAMSMRVKMITTNKEIAKYDFYNSNNIFILDTDNPKLPEEEFFDSEYVDVDKEILEQYSVVSWCRRFEEII